MMKAKILKTILIVLLLLLTKYTYTQGAESEQYTLVENINYTENIENIKNPEKGFYSTAFLRMKPSGTVPTNSRANLVHLRVDIGNFSGAVNGVGDLEFTEDALNALDQTFANIRNNGGSVIIRFAYDGFNGVKDIEPSLDMILKHISQLKPVFEKNKDVLTYVELGFFGPWGEMHSSKVSSTENVSKAIDLMLDTVPESIKIGVRTPNYYAKWLGIDRKTLNENITQKGTDAYRVGLFNDGYLGSESDLGTFANREIEVSWLENQAKHTFYGGEVVANYASKTPLNTIEYMSKEAFRTHTTYLNNEWNDKVIKAWKEEIYNGDDELYVGQTGYNYIANHLGYRFVLRKSEIVNKMEANETLKAKLQIENVGFANLINDKKTTIVLKKDDKTYEIPTNIDATLWNSKEIANVNIEVTLPDNIDLGEWDVYLRISQNGDMNTDNNYKCIQLANYDIWDENFGANYIGKVTISEITEEDTNSDNNLNEDDDTSTGDNLEEIGSNENTGDNNTVEEDNIATNGQTGVKDDPLKTDSDKSTNDKANTNNNENNSSSMVQKEKDYDTTIASGKLPKTGNNIQIIIGILIFIVSTNIVLLAIKIKRF